MRKFILRALLGGLFLLFGISNLIVAQITLTSKDAPSTPGIYFVMESADTVAINPGESGANKYWDFSNIPLTQQAYWRVVDFSTSPFVNRFQNGNLVYEVTEYAADTVFLTYNYARLTETELTQLGRGIYIVVGSNKTIKEIVVAKRTKPQLNLPITYGDPNWSSIFQLDTVYFGLAATVIDSNYNRVDGWGTIRTAFGEFPCLRIRQDHSIFATPVLFPSLKYPIEININYYWVSHDYGIIATVTGMSDVTNPNPDPNYTTAKSVNIMTSFLTSVGDKSPGEIPKQFKLFQNYPNPFNPVTTISYQISEPTEVKLRIFNLAGQEIALLVQAKQMSGRYEIEWNAHNLPSGIYYYQVQANDNLLTGKCLLLK